MKPLIPVLVAFLLLATSAVSAQPVRSAPYTGTPAGTSSGDVLWSQLDEPSGSSFTDQSFEAPYAAYDSTGGDDFIVDGAYGWDLESLFTPGSMSVPGANPLFVNVAFYEDAGGLPGAALNHCDFPANTDFTSAGDGNLTIDVSGCGLYWGHTWVSQQVRQDFNPFGQHYWATRISSNNQEGVWQNPGNGFGNGCLDWQPMNAVCGTTGKDWMFELSGWEVHCSPPAECQPPLEGVPAVGPFGVVLLVIALGGGSAYALRRRR